MNSYLVSDWFGVEFSKLHPLLQQLHQRGGKLSGTVDVKIPTGLAGFIGTRLARKLGIPVGVPRQSLEVCIGHDNGALQWNRTFAGVATMHSEFKPVGVFPHGYWVESTGPFTMYLTVDTANGGWRWKIIKVKFGWLRLPVLLFAGSNAYKRIETDRYNFYVGFTLPFLGSILSYSGLLAPTITEMQVG